MDRHCCWRPPARHIASNGFLTLQVDRAQISGALELAIRDGELAVGLITTGRQSRGGELRVSQTTLQTYVLGHLHLPARSVRREVGPVQVSERVDGSYLWLPINATCGAGVQRLSIDYRILDAEDPSHRGLLTLNAHGASQTAVLGGASQLRSFELDHPSSWAAFIEYLHAGTRHILNGIDHLLFLLSLLLPAVLVRRENRWEAVPTAAPAFTNIVKVVTAFTLAHSITLSLAALDIIRLPGRLTESVIAASIIIAALNNVFPRITEGVGALRSRLACCTDLASPRCSRIWVCRQGARLISLVAFNLGVRQGSSPWCWRHATGLSATASRLPAWHDALGIAGDCRRGTGIVSAARVKLAYEFSSGIRARSIEAQGLLELCAAADSQALGVCTRSSPMLFASHPYLAAPR